MTSPVLVALSGGMDSTYAAWKLKSQGHEVLGVHFRLNPFGHSSELQTDDPAEDTNPRDEKELALVETAKRMGIQVLFLNLGQKFRKRVLTRFVEDYRNGRTPNPCILCNVEMKFPALSQLADRLGASFYATGHYARIAKRPSSGASVIQRAADQTKDQSYFLSRVPCHLITRAIMPLGDMTKRQVETECLEQGICRGPSRPSQDLCFMGPNGYAEVFREFSYTPKPGPIVDVKMGVIGEHDGIGYFTIGQRRGLSVATGKPRYVVAIDPQSNAVYVGCKKRLYSREFIASEVVWTDGQPPDRPVNLDVKIRLKHKAARAQVSAIEGEPTAVKVTFEQEQPAITPGQGAAFYEGDLLVGGGWISSRPDIDMEAGT